MTDQALGRRAALAGAAALAVAARPAAAQPRATTPPPPATHNVPYSTGTEAARTPAPPDATDCHFHIYDRRFPATAGATLLPPDATVENYRALQRRTGTSRGVLIQPSTYGTDNRLHLESMHALGRDRFRMVAVVNDRVTDAELRRLHTQGVRGIRFNLIQAGTTTIDMLEPLSRRIAPLGWHCQIHMTGTQIGDANDLLLRLPSGIVFDHRARLPAAQGLNSPGFTTVLRLLGRGRTWVKLSGLYMDSNAGPPGYADSVAIAKAFFAANPQRMVWGSDWPHPTEALDNKPDDAKLFDLLTDCVPDAAARRRVLVDNPAELYDFPRTGAARRRTG
ncbi:MAG TPA: amidohydrolase family protein [Roseomonas sp.]|jgi:predicted TIM-barrel fold metal-dependent hydrolase